MQIVVELELTPAQLSMLKVLFGTHGSRLFANAKFRRGWRRLQQKLQRAFDDALEAQQ